MYKLSTLLKRLIKYSAKYRLEMIIALIFCVIFVATTLYAPYIIGYEIISLFTNSFALETLFPYLIKLAIVVAIGFIFGLITSRILNKVTYQIIKDIRVDAFNKLLTLPVSYLDSHMHGDILTRITSDVDQVWNGLLHGFTHIFRGFITIIITIIFMFISKWDLALVVVVLTPLSALASYLVSKNAHKSYKKKANTNGELGAFTNEMISEQRTNIAYNLMDENVDRFIEINKVLYKNGLRAQFFASLANPSTRFVNAIVYATVATYGTINIVINPSIMSVGILSIFLFYASQYTSPFNEISNVASELTNSFASFRRVLELIDEEELKNEDNLAKLCVKNGLIDIEDLCFSYIKNMKILENITFKALEGKKVAIVGPTGCGKTTLINLLMRFYNIDKGNIYIDNNNIYSVTSSSLRENVGMVLQDSWLFKGSIKENIAYAKKEATMEEIIEAAKAANAHDFIVKLKDGYNTSIDDESISSGQKQLLCIARVMLTKPKILILDEATSNIDTRTELMVQKAFNNLMNNRTSIIIAHRLSTIRNADLIIVLKDGKIVEQGNHEQLLKLNGFYSSLYRAN